MKKQPANTREERKLKLAEAAVMFVLVLGLTVFVGARLTSRDDADTVATVARTEAVQPPMAEAAPVDSVMIEPETVAAVEPDPVAEAPSALAVEPPRIVTYAMAERAYFDGDYADAVAQFEAYTGDHSENAWGYYMLGLSNWKSGDLDAAGDAFVAALELKPDHLKSLINYSRVLLEQDQPAAARAQIELALQQEPDNVDANRVYSRICHREGDLEQAANGYLKVLQSAGDDVWSLNNYGLIRIEQGRYDEALAPLAKAASLRSDIACVQNNLGAALERTGHFTAAVAAFEMALTADEDYAKADESLTRVSALTEAADQEAVDLVALAQSFSPDSAVTVVAETPAGITEVPGDMDVASTLAQPTDDRDPE